MSMPIYFKFENVSNKNKNKNVSLKWEGTRLRNLKFQGFVKDSKDVEAATGSAECDMTTTTTTSDDTILAAYDTNRIHDGDC